MHKHKNRVKSGSLPKCKKYLVRSKQSKSIRLREKIQKKQVKEPKEY